MPVQRSLLFENIYNMNIKSSTTDTPLGPDKMVTTLGGGRGRGGGRGIVEGIYKRAGQNRGIY